MCYNKNMDLKYDKMADGLIYYKRLIQNPQLIIDSIERSDLKITNDLKKNPQLINKTSLRPWHNWDDKEQHFCKQKFILRTSDLSTNDYYYEDYKNFSDPLFFALDKSFNHYSNIIYPFAGRNIKGKEDVMSVLKYEKSGYLPEHSDHGISSRTLSVVMYLNDDYDGGEISFPQVGVTIKPEAGSAIFFPSNFVFTHQVSEMKNGIRYALPSWYHNMKNKIYSDGTE